MANEKFTRAATASLVIVSLAVAAVCAYGKPTTAHVPENMTSAPPMIVREWTASDLPYKDVENQMAKDFAGGKTPQTISEQYQRLAASRPKDPVAQFAAVIAARGAAREVNPGSILPYTLLETLAKHDPGNVHEYTRLRFCMTEETERQLSLRDTEAIGKKLLQYNPKDNLVKINLIYMLCDAGHAQAALPYAREWVKTEPNNPKTYTSLALVYQDLWVATKNKSYGRLAVKEFQQFLRVASPGDGFRRRAEHSIQVLQEEVARSG